MKTLFSSFDKTDAAITDSELAAELHSLIENNLVSAQDYKSTIITSSVITTYPDILYLADSTNSAPTDISDLSDCHLVPGNYEISYKGSDNLEHTLILALPTQISGRPVVGTTEKDGKLYWTLTSNGKTEILKDVDGSELALEGRAPEIGIDKDGYWTVNNVPIRDSKGDMMASEGKSVSVVTGISVASDKAVFTLGNGKTIEAPFDTFNVRFKHNGQYFLTECIIASAKDPAIINYEFVGEGVKNLSMDDRFTIANMAIEAGGKNGIFPVDELAEAYIKEHSNRPYTIYQADEDAGILHGDGN